MRVGHVCFKQPAEESLVLNSVSDSMTLRYESILALERCDSFAAVICYSLAIFQSFDLTVNSQTNKRIDRALRTSFGVGRGAQPFFEYPRSM